MLDLLLSAQAGSLGLGEIDMLIRDKTRARLDESNCSCGDKTRKCGFWGDLLNRFDENGNETWGQRYESVVTAAKHRIDTGGVIIDSSKYITPLSQILSGIRNGEIQSVKEDEILVVHLLKDPRSYVASMKRAMKKYKKIKLPSFIRMIKYYRSWKKENLRIVKYCESNGVDVLRVSYEALCFRPDLFLTEYLEKMGRDPMTQTVGLNASQSHIGVGNPMRHDQKKSKKIVYDSRWLHDFWVNFWYVVIPGVASTNNKLCQNIMPHKGQDRLFDPK